MAIYRPLFQRFDAFLTAAVANNGTFTVPYPAGTTQQDFDTGLGSVGGEAVINDSDKWLVSAAQVSFTFGAGNITVTNLSGQTWPINAKVSIEIDQQVGNSVEYFQMALLLNTLANGNVYNPGIRPAVLGTIEYMEVVVKAPATTAAKLATITPSINNVAVTGGSLALTSANMTPAGVVLPAPLITGNNVLKAASYLGLIASGVTAFVEGEITVCMRVRATSPFSY